MPTLKERILGCMYGLAIGDALGFPVEFSPPKGIVDFKSAYGLPPGSYSDDTQMSLATARGILNARSTKLGDLMDSTVKEYIKWFKTQSDPAENRFPGNTCLNGVKNLANGVHWLDSGVPNGCGCGAAMRTAPIGLAFYKDQEKLEEFAKVASSCTHGDSSAYTAGIVTASLVSLALNDRSYKIFLNKAFHLGTKHSVKFREKIIQLELELLRDVPAEQSLRELGQGWTGVEAVPLAMYCFLKSPTNYKKTVLMAANTEGDSDSIACIAGAISGAYNGIQAIPETWINRVENSGLIKQTSEEIYNKIIKVPQHKN